MSPFAVDFDPNESAHFYTFKQIATMHKLQQGADGVWRFDGPAIQMPAVYQFTRSSNPNASAEFNVAFSDLLRLLQRAWKEEPKTIGSAVSQMLTLQDKGTTLIRDGIRPEFQWTDKTDLH